MLILAGLRGSSVAERLLSLVSITTMTARLSAAGANNALGTCQSDEQHKQPFYRNGEPYVQKLTFTAEHSLNVKVFLSSG